MFSNFLEQPIHLNGNIRTNPKEEHGVPGPGPGAMTVVDPPPQRPPGGGGAYYFLLHQEHRLEQTTRRGDRYRETPQILIFEKSNLVLRKFQV